MGRVKERRPIAIEHVRPEVDGGRVPVKREVGDCLEVSADILKEGHDRLAAVIRHRAASEPDWREAPLALADNDTWIGSFPLAANTRYLYTIEAWTDVFGSWREEMLRRTAAGQTDLASELAGGAELVRPAPERAHGADAAALEARLERLGGADSQAARLELLIEDSMEAAVGGAQGGRHLYG